MAVLEDAITNFFNKTKRSYSFEKLKKELEIKGENETVKLKKAVRALEVSGVLYQDDSGEYLLFPKEADLVLGHIFVSKKGNGFVDTIDGYRVFISPDQLNGAIEGDTVIVTNTAYDDSNRLIGSIKRIVDRKETNLVCECHNINGKNILFPCGNNQSYNLDINKTKLLKLVDGDRVLINLFYDTEKGNYCSEFIKTIGHRDDPDIDIKTIAYSHGIEVEFSDEVLKELETIPDHVLDEDLIGLKDLRDKTIFTIDGDDTKDIDDAISIETLYNGNYKLGVHIADVSYYVKEGTALFDAAYSRGTSAYLIDSVIPMLPHQLSNGICSLNPGVDRLTLSCEMEIDHNGKIVNYDIFPSVINSRKKMTYKEVNEILHDRSIPEGYEDFVDNLNMMKKLSSIMNNAKKQRGFIDFDSSELKIKVNQYGETINFEARKSDLGEELIENFMIAANESVANYVYWMGLPFVYRIHEKPDEVKINELVQFISQLGFKLDKSEELTPRYIQEMLKQLSMSEKFPVLSDMVLQSMKKARYAAESKGHFGLALDYYTHFTSPIRRLPDLSVHMLIKKYQNLQLKASEIKELNNSLKELCFHASLKEREADAAAQDAQMLKMAGYMENHIGEYFLGNISRVTQYGVMAKTKEGIIGKIDFEDINGDYFVYDSKNMRLVGRKTHQTISFGDPVSLRVVSASKENKTINFGLEKREDIISNGNVKNRHLQKLKQGNRVRCEVIR